MALVKETRTRVRELTGFKKTHQVPQEVNDWTRQFVEKIAAADLSDDLDCRFAEFRKHFQFKRVDLLVSEPDGGVAAIKTPFFEYRVAATLAEDDPAEVNWRCQVSEFLTAESLVSTEFAAVFGSAFDTVEFVPPETIVLEDFIDAMEQRSDLQAEIDYDRAITWCELTVPSIPGTLLVECDRVALITNHPELPAKLLEAFLGFQQQLPSLGD